MFIQYILIICYAMCQYSNITTYIEGAHPTITTNALNSIKAIKNDIAQLPR